jgi:hypothetical protein
MNEEIALNIQNAIANFKRDYVNFRPITHDLKFKMVAHKESEGRLFMQRAFKAYAAGKDSTGDTYAKLAEYQFVQAQLLKDYVIAKPEARCQIASKIKPFNS